MQTAIASVAIVAVLLLALIDSWILCANRQPLPVPIFRDSTYAFGVIEGVEHSRALGQLPSSFVIYCIEGENFEAELGMSPAMLDAVNEPAKKLLQEIKGM